MALELPDGAKIVIDSNDLIEKVDRDIKKYGGQKIVYAVIEHYGQYPNIQYVTHYFSPDEWVYDNHTLGFHPYDIAHKKNIIQCTLTALRTKLDAQASYY